MKVAAPKLPTSRDEQAVQAAVRPTFYGCPSTMPDAVEAGLAAGRAVYGPLDLESDPRDFRQEAVEELRDAVVYLGALIVQAERRGAATDAERRALRAVVEAWRGVGGG